MLRCQATTTIRGSVRFPRHPGRVTAMARKHFGWRCAFVGALTFGWFAIHLPVVLATEITPFSDEYKDSGGLSSLFSRPLFGGTPGSWPAASGAVPVAPSVISVTSLRPVLTTPTYRLTASSLAKSKRTDCTTSAAPTTASTPTFDGVGRHGRHHVGHHLDHGQDGGHHRLHDERLDNHGQPPDGRQNNRVRGGLFVFPLVFLLDRP